MFQKMKEKYKQYGLTGLLLSGIAYGCKQTAKIFLNLAELSSTKVPLSPAEKKLLIRNHIFKDKHKGRRCFVIGNGPSLNKQDLSLLSDEITIVVNAFYKNPIVEKWQPTYYCFADPILFIGSKQRINDFFHNLRSKIHSSIFLAPTYAQKIITDQNMLPLGQTYYATFRGNLGESLKYDINLVKSIPGVQSVSQLGIMWAMYMGCSPIYLIGLDHDWLSYPAGIEPHFYNANIVNNYSKVYRSLNGYCYKDNLKSVLNLWKGYETILRIASNKNISIINSTEGGLLDVFERREYKSIFLSLN